MLFRSKIDEENLPIKLIINDEPVLESGQLYVRIDNQLHPATMVVILPGVVSRNRINCFAHRRG